MVSRDRLTCHGLWFDDGELNKLRNTKAAAVLDIGNVTTGKKQNEIENYRCPRCAGEMTDLVTVSVSDFFKRFVSTERR